MMKLNFTLLFLFYVCFGFAQNAAPDYRHNLDKRITVSIQRQPLGSVLEQIGKAGDFYFSYIGKLIRQDSIVSLNVQSKPVRDILDQLFDGKVDYREFREHIVLRYAANRFTIEPENIISAEDLYTISGFVVDLRTGKRVKQASVYEKRLLQSGLTDENGYFRLRFKGNYNEVILTASKENYRDTSLIFLADLKIRPEGYSDNDDEFMKRVGNAIESSGISRFFISSRQRVQSLNIPDFFANTPFQASLTPGLSSHGMMSSQVINKFSLNVIGGYTAGVNGFEMGGMFNISKGDVNKAQIAGGFNAIGGSVNGVQIGGLLNDVRSGMNGVQVAGAVNRVQRSMTGVQIGGVLNLVADSVRGTQIAGAVNIGTKKTDGLQVAGAVNIAAKGFRGTQIGLLNYARDMDGLQIGLFNVSSRNDGVSIGLINLVQHGYHKISLSSNELINTNAAFKMGNANLYNILFAGKNFSDTARMETAGLGFGHDFIFSNRFSIATEATSQYIYLGNWDYANFLNRFQANVQVQLVKGLTVFAGLVYSVYTSEAPVGSSAGGYKQQVYPDRRHDFTGDVKGWWGFNFGITLF
ncbi:hypothetical protein [Pedobacter sp. JY14-1]|uniref:LA_2272 family surface repeat-containing protein n=1 Tax=Pedobacter sp. JY14-1 TaxID=3034151 RepID=UPI0023E0F5D6|nr:hypothetical protein [Pedobacter sp. JY14-1]